MSENPSQRFMNVYAFLLRLLGLFAVVIAAILNRDRAGDWFFRSETFSDTYAPVLLALRIASALAGIGLLAFGGRLENRIERWWRDLSEAQRITFETVALVLCGTVVYALSLYFRENLVFIEQVTPYKGRFKMLGFDVIIQSDEMRTADFLTSFFLVMAGMLCYAVHALHRFKVIPERKGSDFSSGTMWLLFSLGFFFLALDEFFGIHEFIGNNIALIDRIKLTSHPDDMVIGAYFLAAMGVLLRYRRYMLSFKPGLYLLVVGAALHFLATISDAYITTGFLEEGLEEVSIIFYFGAMSQYAVREVLSIGPGGG